MQIALQYRNTDGASIIPILLRPCMWKETPFANVHVLPTNVMPISLWEDQNAAFANVVDGIEQVVELQKQQGFLEKSIQREPLATPTPIEIYFVYAYDRRVFFSRYITTSILYIKKP